MVLPSFLHHFGDIRRHWAWFVDVGFLDPDQSLWHLESSRNSPAFKTTIAAILPGLSWMPGNTRFSGYRLPGLRSRPR
jgi:hypothetical protein